MSTHPNPNADLFRSLEALFMASELPTGDAAKVPPEWIKATPKGPVTARDGRSFTFDPARLAARFSADNVQIPVDLDHSTILLGARGETPKTVGYASDVEARDDGTYVRVQWNPAGLAAFAAGTHRYVSPTVFTDDARTVTWLHSVALVSAPALADMPSLMAAMGLGGGRAPAQLAVFAGALNLPATADEAAILLAIGGMVPKAAHEATLSMLASTSEKLNALTASTRSGEVTATLDKAIRERKILPAQRDEYLAMCATDVGLETFQRLMTKTPDLFPPSGLDGKRVQDGDRPTTAAGIIEKAQLLQAEKAKLGIPLSMVEAISAVAPRNHA